MLGEARRRRFAAREVVLHAGDPADALHLISKGRVVVRRPSHAGGSATLGFLGPGEFFGELALVAPEALPHRTATIEAVEPTETLTIRADRLADLRRRHPAIDRFLVELLAARVAVLDGLLVEALQVPAEIRVLRRLAAAAEQFGQRDPSGAVAVPITQEDLAAIAGTSRATTNRTLRAAMRAGALKLGRSRIEIIDSEVLSRLSG